MARKHNYPKNRKKQSAATIKEAAVKRSFTVYQKNIYNDINKKTLKSNVIPGTVITTLEEYKKAYSSFMNDPNKQLRNKKGKIVRGSLYTEINKDGESVNKIVKMSAAEYLSQQTMNTLTKYEKHAVFKEFDDYFKKNNDFNIWDMDDTSNRTLYNFKYSLNIGLNFFYFNFNGNTYQIDLKNLKESLSTLKRNVVYAFLISIGYETKEDLDQYYAGTYQ